MDEWRSEFRQWQIRAHFLSYYTLEEIYSHANVVLASHLGCCWLDGGGVAGWPDQRQSLTDWLHAVAVFHGEVVEVGSFSLTSPIQQSAAARVGGRVEQAVVGVHSE